MPDTSLYHFTPQAVAKQIDVSVQSVRRWADTYKEFLSESANPAAGKTRLYTWADVQTLRRIKDLRDSGLTPEAITISLSESTKSLPEDTNAIVPPIAPDARHATPAPLVGQEYIMSIERRFEALERSQRHAVYYMALGIGIGLFLAVVFELAALVATRVH